MPRIPGAGPNQGQADQVTTGTGLVPEGSGGGLPPPSQLELCWQGLAAVLDEGAGHTVQTTVPCLLMLIPQEEAQHG